MVVSQSLLFLGSMAAIICLSAAGQLPESEVRALVEIAKTLGMSLDIAENGVTCDCSDDNTRRCNSTEIQALKCNCSFDNNTRCHVTEIDLSNTTLTGTLPKNLTGIPFLEILNLNRNFLNGPIPLEWGSSKLVTISMGENGISGSIPKELGNISTLENLGLEMNHLSGKLPAELGKLTRIKRLLITSNNLTGELPTTLAKLANLEDFYAGDNKFTGLIPEFILNWTKLNKIFFHASGFTGPVPASISKLKNISDMRITDLSGPEATFPPLENMPNLKTLILRNCNLKGRIPDNFKDMPNLTYLDLSFNKLNGEIPISLTTLSHLKDLFLTGNMLTGTVPRQLILRDNVDLSYNNLRTGPSECQQGKVNFFASSSGANMSGVPLCLGRPICTKPLFSLHINCGGPRMRINNTEYEEDTFPATSSSFSESSSRHWGVSTTGFFTDQKNRLNNYISQNTTRLTMEIPELYMNARLTPISLTYYAFCLGNGNGNYTVRLHFAEIVFTNDQTYLSLGRRMFDVYIQGKLVLKDFNIAAEAGGAGKAIVRDFLANVTDSTLEVRFYWAGRGTQAIPDRGVYGPLISAISMYSNFAPPVPPTNRHMPIGEEIGLVASGTVVVLAVASLLWWMFCLKKKRNREQDISGSELSTGKFTLRQIKAATNNFDATNKIGEGGFGPVYKGLLSDGTVIAVKQLSSKSKQGNREFLNEVAMFSALQHPHLVKLYGCCTEADQLLLVYEFMPNNNVGRALFGPEASQIKLDWPTRRKICIGVARGLAFLHEESRLKIVHRDIKVANILLDKDLNPKISDFGLAKLDEEDNTHISTRIAGTYGYMAPEYAMRGHLTDKADVYSYGIVVLEIISGRSNTTYRANQKSFYILDWALLLKEKGDLMEMVDPRLGLDYDREEVLLTIELALQCASVSAAARPSMSSVVSVLEGKTPLQDAAIVNEISSKTVLDEMRRRYEEIQEDGQTRTSSLDESLTQPSTFDLYPGNPYSDYYGESTS